MISDLLKTLENLKSVWVIGGSAVDRAPPEWLDVAKDDPHPDLLLLAIAGQSMSFVMRPVPNRGLDSMPLPPTLGQPFAPEPAREQIRYLVKGLKLPESQMSDIARLLEARGYAMNPIDYWPKNFSSFSSLYSPWETWDRMEQPNPAPEAALPETELSSENWDLWRPAERRLALVSLRRQNPAVARQLIAEKLSLLNAEERFRLIELLSEGLGIDDHEFLKQIEQDRSNKVRRLVQHYLARLGAPARLSDDGLEYAQFFSIANVDLDGGIRVTANILKTAAQRKRRAELATNISLRDFAFALKLTNEEELVKAWENTDPLASEEFVRMVASSGSENSIALLANRIGLLDGITAEALQQLFDRMSQQTRRDLLPRILKHDEATFSATLRCCGTMLGEISWEQLSDAPAIQALLKISADESSANFQQRETLKQGLTALGLLASQSAAQQLIHVFTEAKLFQSDPLLSILKLNLCLPQIPCIPQNADHKEIICE